MNDTLSQSSPSNADLPPNRAGFFHFWRCFWLTFLVVSLAYAWYCFYVPSNSITWAQGQTVAQPQTSESDKPTILFFTGKWCVPCRIMKRQVWADEQVKSIVNASFVPVMVNVDDPAASELMRRYQVGAPPTTTIVDSQGHVLQQRCGGMSKAEFLELLEASHELSDANMPNQP